VLAFQYSRPTTRPGRGVDLAKAGGRLLGDDRVWVVAVEAEPGDVRVA
jgi:hypothetical protein